MEYITWATGVNTKVLDGTTIEVGKGYVEDSESNGSFSNRRLSSLAMPETYNVQMSFDWSEKDENGLSEFDRFINWYKYIHCRGVNPFEFPSITKFATNGTDKFSYYRITGDLSISKSGLSFNVSMKWTEFINRVITIPDETVTITSVNAYATDSAQYIYVGYSSRLTTLPASTSVTITVNGTQRTVLSVTPSYANATQYKFKISDSAWSSGRYTYSIAYTEDGVSKTLSNTLEVS